MDFPIDIRLLPSARWREYRELRLRALREHPEAFGEPLARAEGHPDSFWQDRLEDAEAGRSWLLFAELGGRLVGMAGAFRPEPDDEPVMTMVVSVFVVGDVRGDGVATALLDRLLSDLADARMERAILHVTASRDDAVRLYSRLGFVEIGRESGMTGDGQRHEMLVMERLLA